MGKTLIVLMVGTLSGLASAKGFNLGCRKPVILTGWN